MEPTASWASQNGTCYMNVFLCNLLLHLVTPSLGRIKHQCIDAACRRLDGHDVCEWWHTLCSKPLQCSICVVLLCWFMQWMKRSLYFPKWKFETFQITDTIVWQMVQHCSNIWGTFFAFLQSWLYERAVGSKVLQAACEMEYCGLSKTMDLQCSALCV